MGSELNKEKKMSFFSQSDFSFTQLILPHSIIDAVLCGNLSLFSIANIYDSIWQCLRSGVIPLRKSTNIAVCTKNLPHPGLLNPTRMLWFCFPRGIFDLFSPFLTLSLPTQIILCMSVVFYLYYRAITYPCKCMPKYLRVAQFSYQLEKENIMGEKRIFDPLQVNLILYYMALGKMKLHFLNIGLQYVFFSSFIGIF